MTRLSGDERARYVQDMFTRIAPRYDLLNRLMTGGQDAQWRREVISRARLTPSARLLDVGTGTGELAREALRQQPSAQVMAADFTLAMMRRGQPMPGLQWAAADARQLPFRSQAFDAVVSGFLMRNVGDVRPVLAEQYRLLKSGGRVVILDTTRPNRTWLSPFIWAHLHLVIPFVGGLVSGSRNAYTYLPESTEHFLRAEDLAACLAEAGFQQVGFRRLMFGTIALHWAQRS